MRHDGLCMKSVGAVVGEMEIPSTVLAMVLAHEVHDNNGLW